MSKTVPKYWISIATIAVFASILVWAGYSIVIGYIMARPVEWQQHSPSCAGSIKSLFLADLNGDDNLDILTASSAAGVVAWYPNNLGTTGDFFGPQRLLPISSGRLISSAVAVDIDSDGDLDVLSALFGKLEWYENIDGAGTFSSPIEIDRRYVSSACLDQDPPADPDPHDATATVRICDTRITLHTADLDNDTDQDIVVAIPKINKIAWYENTDSAGGFGDQQVITTNASLVTSIFAADVDLDGDLDILSASGGDNKIAWYENLNADAAFGPERVITEDAMWAQSVHACDIDLDGDVDVITSSSEDDTIAWHENLDGAGRFGQQRVISRSAHGARSVHGADLDGDGDCDAISTSRGDLKVAWYENTDGRGNFGGQTVLMTNFPRSNAIAADIDSDGDIDVISASTSHSRALNFHENLSGTGVFDSVFDSARPIHQCLSEPTSFGSADLDGDGDQDILAGYWTSITGSFGTLEDSGVLVYENLDGEGTFSPARTVANSLRGKQSVYAADIDGDGDDDIVAASFALQDDPSLAWYENVGGQGRFGQARYLPESRPYVEAIVAADLDGDEDVDVVSAVRVHDHIYFVRYENVSGRGYFERKEELPFYGWQSVPLYLRDLDGDGDLDLIGDRALLENKNGILSRWEHDLHGTMTGAPADVDSDGDIDMLGFWNKSIYWMENLDGNGNFGEGVEVADVSAWLDARRSVSAIHVHDFDGDSAPDLLWRSFLGGKIGWFRNLGNSRGFGGTSWAINDDGHHQLLHPADIDGDGDVDLFAGSLENIIWYENLSRR